ncbi:MAG: MerR family transcriptional regulator [Clostridia bacterium]
MRIKIGDMAKMLGVVPSTLRYYEKKGIVKPEIDGDTKYRYFHAKDMVWLILCRTFHQTGFSLAETVDLIYNMPYARALDSMEQKKIEMHHRTVQARLLENHVMEQGAYWEYARKHIGHCGMWSRPDMLRLDFFGEKLFSDEARMALVTAWLKYMPQVYLQQMVPPEALPVGTRGLDGIWGLAVAKELAEKIGVPTSNLLRHVKACLCVHTAFYIGINGPLEPSHYAHALSFIEQHRFTICGDAETRVVSFSGEKKARKALLVMDIPVC